jgi:hypothetical protein
MGISFDSSMSSWQKGAKPEEGVWAKYRYSAIYNATGAVRLRTKKEPFPEELRPLLNQCMSYYNQLMELAK